MALSNIFREPRREITESVVGLTIFGTVMWADYRFAAWFEDVCGRDKDGPAVPWELGMFVGIIIAVVLLLLVPLTHGLGSLACDALDGLGVHLRPRIRPAQRR